MFSYLFLIYVTLPPHLTFLYLINIMTFVQALNYKVDCHAALSSLLSHLNILIQNPILKYPQPTKYLVVYFQSVHLFHLYQTVILLKALIFIAQIKMHKEILLIKKNNILYHVIIFIALISLFSFVWQIKYHTHIKCGLFRFSQQ
jgi:hypothetical protein